ncbi:hypothetical protein [Amycolatopsis sp. BJA-103]|uniref:hypothetical protein n=1 Tax=Amycolatopsis sp. BJA-103 TaxID=1911175 RepID=UPI000C76ED90|nr:hypothetical protein [Amycolatopsis sp. BJA-103]AUI56770.1 hypothetical protein BKN51_00115 [Amycolatopsis sp. BJA-103]AUI64128.1 hypothetical protein BKN51_42260 [Amycolatopsis sp. BJA-103]PNE13091.1 hypothetical protein B1H26_42420 [Amycolatopsis sp. BJA-103]
MTAVLLVDLGAVFFEINGETHRARLDRVPADGQQVQTLCGAIAKVEYREPVRPIVGQPIPWCRRCNHLHEVDIAAGGPRQVAPRRPPTPHPRHEMRRQLGTGSSS